MKSQQIVVPTTTWSASVAVGLAVVQLGARNRGPCMRTLGQRWRHSGCQTAQESPFVFCCESRLQTSHQCCTSVWQRPAHYSVKHVQLYHKHENPSPGPRAPSTFLNQAFLKHPPPPVASRTTAREEPKKDCGTKRPSGTISIHFLIRFYQTVIS